MQVLVIAVFIIVFCLILFLLLINCFMIGFLLFSLVSAQPFLSFSFWWFCPQASIFVINFQVRQQIAHHFYVLNLFSFGFDLLKLKLARSFLSQILKNLMFRKASKQTLAMFMHSTFQLVLFYEKLYPRLAVNYFMMLIWLLLDYTLSHTSK